MRMRNIHVYWLLIAIPTLLLGMAAARLLHGEQARMRALAGRAAAERVGRLAETVRGMVAAMEQDVMTQIEALPPTGYEPALRDWLRHDPRVRNVFIWSPRDGVVYPVARGATVEERRFLQRYAPLFQREVPWAQESGADDGGLAALPAASPEARARQALDEMRLTARQVAIPSAPVVAQSAAPVLAKRGRMAGEPARTEARAAEAESAAAAAAPTLPPGESGTSSLNALVAADAAAFTAGRWRAWFEGNQLYLLGWQRLADGTIRGVELETATLLSRLPAVFESSRDPDACFALKNGEGMVLVQAGGAPDTPRRVDVRVPLAPELPHWEIAFCRLRADDAGRPYLLAAWLLLSLVLASLVAGGLLLMRDAAAQRRDALQKTSFVSSVSHELKTPLTSIRLYAELLRDGRVGDALKRSRYLNVIVAESERLTRLVNNVLDFSRMEQGRRRYALESADLARVLREVVEAQRGRIEAAGLRLELAAGREPVVLPIDRDAVEQVIVNLLDNAVKYAADGGEVTVTLLPRSDGADILVEDRGPGIAPPHRKRLFESFYRVDCELTAKCSGCGLGLSIARRLVRGMGGDLTFAPREGGGSRFTLRLGGRTEGAKEMES